MSENGFIIGQEEINRRSRVQQHWTALGKEERLRRKLLVSQNQSLIESLIERVRVFRNLPDREEGRRQAERTMQVLIKLCDRASRREIAYYGE